MKPIITKYIGPTNTMGGRIKATFDRVSVVRPYNDGLSETQNHVAAAQRLANREGLHFIWYRTERPDREAGFVFAPVVDRASWSFDTTEECCAVKP
jgi:hypothetical protein